MIKLKRHEIDVEWIKKNVSKNPDFIKSKLPEPVRNLIEDGKMPKYIEKELLSGNYNETEMKKLLFQDDEVVKLLLPSELTEMLQVTFFQ